MTRQLQCDPATPPLLYKNQIRTNISRRKYNQEIRRQTGSDNKYNKYAGASWGATLQDSLTLSCLVLPLPNHHLCHHRCHWKSIFTFQQESYIVLPSIASKYGFYVHWLLCTFLLYPHSHQSTSLGGASLVLRAIGGWLS